MSGLQGYELAYDLVWRGASLTDVVAQGRAATSPLAGGEYMFAQGEQFLFDLNCDKINLNFNRIARKETLANAILFLQFFYRN